MSAELDCSPRRESLYLLSMRRLTRSSIVRDLVVCAGVALIFAGTLAVRAVAQNGGSAAVAYPEGYRTWAHVKTGLVSSRHPTFANSGGFRHIYANPQALAGYKSGTFPDGAVIVVDWLEGVDKDGAFTEGSRRRLDVMAKDKARFFATRGWGFEQFMGDTRTERGVQAADKQCVACHTGPGTRDLVFSKFRD